MTTDPIKTAEAVLADPDTALIKQIVERFLSWKLPDDFAPDGGISYSPTFNTGTPYEGKNNPSGTNLLSYTQAEAMVRHILADVDLLEKVEEWDGPLTEAEQAKIDAAWERHKAATPALIQYAPEDVEELCRQLEDVEHMTQANGLEALLKTGKEAATLLRAQAAQIAHMREMFRLDGEQHATAIREARQSQQVRVDAYAAEIDRLKAEIAGLTAKVDFAHEEGLVQSEHIEHLKAEIARLTAPVGDAEQDELVEKERDVSRFVQSVREEIKQGARPNKGRFRLNAAPTSVTQPAPAPSRAEIEAVEAIKFALDEDDPGNCQEFLRAWLRDDWRTEWPEFQDTLDRHAGQSSAQEVGDTKGGFDNNPDARP